MTSVRFVVPAHGRVEVSRFAFAGLAWCCDELVAGGVDANVWVVADDENLELAREHGFGTVEAANSPLGSKWNDGFEAAAAEGCDFAITCGSDDWVHPALVAAWVDAAAFDGRSVVATRESAAVSPDGAEVALLRIPYEGGDGVRMYPRELLERVEFRPAIDGRDRAIDGSMRDRLARSGPLRFAYVDRGPLSIVDFKSDVEQLTGYPALVRSFATETRPDVWLQLADAGFPVPLVAQAERFYGRVAA